MPKLIQKSGFIKPGKAGGYIGYIATRDGVEKLPGPEGYVEYMAMRPGAERHDGHGLFSSHPVDLDAVMEEAEHLRLGVLTFEDEQLEDEPPGNTRFGDPDVSNEDKRFVIEALERDWEDGRSTASAYQLGRLWRDRLGVVPDDEKAELWFRRAAEAGTAMLSMRWQSSCKSREGSSRRYSGMSRRRRAAISLPAIKWASSTSKVPR